MIRSHLKIRLSNSENLRVRGSSTAVKTIKMPVISILLGAIFIFAPLILADNILAKSGNSEVSPDPSVLFDINFDYSGDGRIEYFSGTGLAIHLITSDRMRMTPAQKRHQFTEVRKRLTDLNNRDFGPAVELDFFPNSTISNRIEDRNNLYIVFANQDESDTIFDLFSLNKNSFEVYEDGDCRSFFNTRNKGNRAKKAFVILRDTAWARDDCFNRLLYGYPYIFSISEKNAMERLNQPIYDYVSCFQTIRLIDANRNEMEEQIRNCFIQ